MNNITLNKIQYRIWFDSELQESDNRCNVSIAAKIEGALNKDILQQSLAYYCQEYSVLRSVVVPGTQGKAYWQPDENFKVPLTVFHEGVFNNDETHKKIEDYSAKPFDIKKEYPSRFYLHCFKNNIYVFCVVFHHSIADTRGYENFCARLSTIYNSILIGATPPETLEPSAKKVEATYGFDADTNIEQAINEFADYLGDASFFTKIHEFNDANGGDTELNFTLGNHLVKKCADFCTKEQTSMFRLFCAAWGLTICRCLGMESLVLDYPQDMRTTEFKHAAGAFVNNFPLKIDARPGTTIRNIINDVKKGRALAKRFPAVSYMDLIPALRKKSEGFASAPNLIINYPISTKMASYTFKECKSDFFMMPIADLAEDIGIYIYDNEEGNSTIYCKKNIPQYFAETLSEVFKTILLQAVENPDANIDTFTIVTNDFTNQVKASAQVKAFSPDETLWQKLLIYKQELASTPAVKCGNTAISYAQIEDLSNTVASAVLAKIEGKQNPKVAVCLSRNAYAIPTILGIMKAGAAYVPIDPQSPSERTEYILSDSASEFVITEKGTPLPDKICSKVYFDDLLATHNHFNEPRIHENDTAYIIYTSGTTGRPKAVPIMLKSLNQLTYNILNHNKWFGKGDNVLQIASLSFDASVVDIFPALYAGATIVMADDNERKDMNLLLNLLEREKISFATISPALMSVMPVKELPHLKTLVFAGEATPRETFMRWNAPGRRIVNAYGPTENSVCSTFADIKPDSSPTDIGRPLTNVTCYVLDKKNRLLPFGVQGELCLGGNQLSPGYLNNPDANATKFTPNPYSTESEQALGLNTTLYHTGDLVYLKPGFNIEFSGRTDFQLKINGYRIEPGEIEVALESLDGIKQAAVEAVAGAGTEKRIAAYIKFSGKPIAKDELKKMLKDKLPEYMIPALWYSVEEFPLTVNGKIDRRAMTKTATDINAESKQIAKPETGAEHIVAKIFASLLNIDKISVEDDLIDDLGVESIQVMSATYEAAQQGIKLPASSVFKNRTIRKILRDNKAYPYYWLNEYDPAKPVIIITCGLPHLYMMYEELSNLLKKDYSVFVIESVYELFLFKDCCTFDDVVKAYTKIITENLQGKKIFGITGYSLGAEIALQLAVELQNTPLNPEYVFSIDGFIFTELTCDLPVVFLNHPNTSPEINVEQNRIKDEILATEYYRPYNGKVISFLSDIVCESSPLAGESPEDSTEFMRKRFEHNPENWRKYQPDCIIKYLHGDHYTIMTRENMVEVKKTIDTFKNI